MFKIGEFSKLVQVPVPTLRYYDQVGLLKPGHVDRFTGYRYYSADQLPRLHRILALRGLGFSLEQIAEALDEDLTPEQMRGMLRLRHAQINQELIDAQNKLLEVEVRLQQIEREKEMSGYDVLLKQVEPTLVALVRAIVPTHAMVGKLFAEVYEALGEHFSEAPGATMVLWYDKEFKEYDVDGAAAYVLPSRVPERGHMEVVELPASTMASTVHHGTYNTINEAHEAVLRWIEANGYRIVGPDREVYLYNKAPIRRDDPSYVTEIQYPVEKAELVADDDPPLPAKTFNAMEADEVVDIPPNRVKFFGTTGKMLLPSPATVAALIEKIPENQLITTELLVKELTERFGVQGTCPITTRKALNAISYNDDDAVPYWRVVRANGELNASFPGGVDGQAELLREEGFDIDTSGKAPKVKRFKEKLAQID